MAIRELCLSADYNYIPEGEVVINSLRFRLSFVSFLAALIMALVAGPAAAQNTSSSIRVVVTDQNGAAVSGVSINVTHIPTGRSRLEASNNEGVVNARGLAIGGPYEVSIVAGGDYAADVQQGISVALDKATVVNLTVRSVVEEVVVTASAPTQEVVVGVG